MKIISREPKIRKHIDPIVVEYLNKKGLLEIYESYLRFRIKQIIEEWSPETFFEYYLITGGLPKYIDLLLSEKKQYY